MPPPVRKKTARASGKGSFMDSIKQVLIVCDGGYPGIAKLGRTRSYSDFPGDFVVKCEAAAVQPGQLLASCYHPSCCRACPQHGDCFGEICKVQRKYPGGDTEGEVHRD